MNTNKKKKMMTTKEKMLNKLSFLCHTCKIGCCNMQKTNAGIPFVVQLLQCILDSKVMASTINSPHTSIELITQHKYN